MFSTEPVSGRALGGWLGGAPDGRWSALLPGAPEAVLPPPLLESESLAGLPAGSRGAPAGGLAGSPGELPLIRDELTVRRCGVADWLPEERLELPMVRTGRVVVRRVSSCPDAAVRRSRALAEPLPDGLLSSWASVNQPSEF